MIPGRAGGERALIARLARAPRSPRVRIGPGDDAAVALPSRAGFLELLTIDTVVENQHFSLRHSTPRQAGLKALEANVSDIAAMGGEPLLALVALTVPREFPETSVLELQAGIHESADRHGIDVVGGDMTRGPVLVITIALTGEAREEELATRSGARPGDLVMVSGGLGASEAGRMVLDRGLAGFAELARRHLEPEARPLASRAVRGRVTAMEDVSDGLATELQNIAAASGCGVLLRAADIPIDARVREAAAALGADPLEWALFGGEDYELVYTARPDASPGLPGFACGVVTAGDGVRLETESGTREITRSGWDPFR